MICSETLVATGGTWAVKNNSSSSIINQCCYRTSDPFRQDELTAVLLLSWQMLGPLYVLNTKTCPARYCAVALFCPHRMGSVLNKAFLKALKTLAGDLFWSITHIIVHVRCVKHSSRCVMETGKLFRSSTVCPALFTGAAAMQEDVEPCII